jgi:zinc finger protein
MFAIPELDFEMAPGSLDSMYTTVEGLLDKLHDALTENNPFGTGDSKVNDKYLQFLTSLQELKEFKRGPFHIVLDDALSNCFIYNPRAPEADPQVEITVYQRTFDQNEELGINDMKC